MDFVKKYLEDVGFALVIKCGNCKKMLIENNYDNDCGTITWNIFEDDGYFQCQVCKKIICPDCSDKSDIILVCQKCTK